MGFQKATELHKQATLAVIEWIAEKHGEAAADWWLWEATPLPCWLPSERQLWDGMRLALGEFSLIQFKERVRGKFEYEMRLKDRYDRQARAVIPEDEEEAA
jgi:hypothetical protein